MRILWSKTEPDDWVGSCGDHTVEIQYYVDPVDEPWVWTVTYQGEKTPTVVAAGYEDTLKAAKNEVARAIERNLPERGSARC
jgi:hypothetical protein